jgi:hypothetical protein
MSSATIVDSEGEKLDVKDKDVSATSTPPNTSLDAGQDIEKPAPAKDPSDDTPDPISKIRMILLILGLTLSMVLVALDFVPSPPRRQLTVTEYHHYGNPSNYR